MEHGGLKLTVMALTKTPRHKHLGFGQQNGAQLVRSRELLQKYFPSSSLQFWSFCSGLSFMSLHTVEIYVHFLNGTGNYAYIMLLFVSIKC